MLTAWLGDAGFLRKFRMEMRRMNRPGNTTVMQGCIVRKYIEDGQHMIDYGIWAENEGEGDHYPYQGHRNPAVPR